MTRSVVDVDFTSLQIFLRLRVFLIRESPNRFRLPTLTVKNTVDRFIYFSFNVLVNDSISRRYRYRKEKKWRGKKMKKKMKRNENSCAIPLNGLLSILHINCSISIKVCIITNDTLTNTSLSISPIRLYDYKRQVNKVF